MNFQPKPTRLTDQPVQRHDPVHQPAIITVSDLHNCNLIKTVRFHRMAIGVPHPEERVSGLSPVEKAHRYHQPVTGLEAQTRGILVVPQNPTVIHPLRMGFQRPPAAALIFQQNILSPEGKSLAVRIFARER